VGFKPPPPVKLPISAEFRKAVLRLFRPDSLWTGGWTDGEPCVTCSPEMYEALSSETGGRIRIVYRFKSSDAVIVCPSHCVAANFRRT
jgi:hypothetical protein